MPDVSLNTDSPGRNMITKSGEAANWSEYSFAASRDM